MEEANVTRDLSAKDGKDPDAYSHITRAQLQEDPSALDLAVDALRRSGCTYFRATDIEQEGLVWIEGWDTRPDLEAPFDPPYTWGNVG